MSNPNPSKKIVVVTGIVVFLVAYVLFYNFTSPSTDKPEEEVTDTIETPIIDVIEIIPAQQEMLDAKIQDGKVQLNNVIITLPITVEDFVNQTGLKFSEKYSKDLSLSSYLEPNKEIKAYFTSNNKNIISVTIANTSDKLKYLKGCYIKSVGIAENTNDEVTKANREMLYLFNGLTYHDNYSNYEDYLTNIEWTKKLSEERDSITVFIYEFENYKLLICYDTETKIIKELKYTILD